MESGPDFAALFELCHCGKESCEACSGYQLTPRTAVALWHMGGLFADQAYDDLLEHGGWAGLECYPDLPEHEADFDWSMALECLFQDTDILSLFKPELDGVKDSGSGPNEWLRMGDYRPMAWFETFNNMEPRDGRRPFRR